ncbi:nucleoside-diphosphate kinase [Candidatus Bathyarchaeota archaeon ex4484_205]|nr:MAG: nucleoside-diphosphate kinase [Candidatus Bathyarchaeota archaeon ex4484_205]HDN18362.1 nucleoside-diphosphate kinase [Candidatus Bathyarchaeota archaeon]
MPLKVERTLVLLKPDCVMRGLIGKVISRIEERGFSIIGLKLLKMDRSTAEKLYEEHRNKPFYEPLLRFMMSGPVVAIVVEGPSAVSAMRQMLGSTNPLDAQAGSIRADYAISNRKNIAHASDSIESAEKEINIFFKESELTSYVRPSEAAYLT